MGFASAQQLLISVICACARIVRAKVTCEEETSQKERLFKVRSFCAKPKKSPYQTPDLCLSFAKHLDDPHVLQEYIGPRASRRSLTFFAVFPFPARQTGQLPVAVAGVVAESVVPGRTFLGATVSVVAFVADKPVRIPQLCLISGPRIRRPSGPYAHLSVDGHKAYQELWVVGI